MRVKTRCRCCWILLVSLVLGWSQANVEEYTTNESLLEPDKLQLSPKTGEDTKSSTNTVTVTSPGPNDVTSDSGRSTLMGRRDEATQKSWIDTSIGTTVTTEETETEFWEYKLSLLVQAYAGLVIVVLGLVGNTLCIAVMSQSHLRNSTGIYLINLACADLTVTLVGQLSRVFPRALTGIDTGSLEPWWCKTWFFINHSAKTISGWTLVAVTIERALVVFFPLKAKDICTKRRAKLALVAINLLCMSCYLHYFWTYGAVYEVNDKNKTELVAGCSILKDNPDLVPYIMDVRPWQDFFVRSAAIFFCLLVCNCLIIGKLFCEYRRRLAMATGKGKTDDRTASVTAMLLTVSFAHLICIAPMQIMYLIDKSDPFGWEIQHRWQAVVALRWAFAIDVYYANHAINFLLYCISGHEFRRNLRLLFARIPGCHRCAPPRSLDSWHGRTSVYTVKESMESGLDKV